MSNLVILINLLAQTIGGDIKTNKTAIAQLLSKQGDLSTLNTTHKSTLVGALNELKGQIDNIDLTSLIDDGDTSATDSTLSASKISTLITQAKDDILGGAGAAFDTLKELQDALQNNPDVVTNIQTALAKRVRVDAEQDFSAAEKAQGRANIGAASEANHQALKSGVGDYAAADFVATYVAARDAE